MGWTDQANNTGTRYKLLVYYYESELKQKQTFWAFLSEEKKGTAIAALEKRIINKYAKGRYKTAILYDNGVELKRWEDGIEKSVSN